MIPVFEPIIGEEEISAVVAALRRGEISGSFGESIRQFEQEFARYCGCKYGVAVSSGTTALQLAVAAAGIGAGDEVLVSACTNVATALAAYHNGAVAVPVDAEEVTWNLDIGLIEPLLTPRTRAIIPVHLYGHPVDMERLCQTAKKAGLLVIEDCAESHGAQWRGKRTGSFGDMGCFSFYANKIVTTGEGGMVVTDDPSLDARLRLLRNLAFTEPRFRHEVAGYNFRMTGYQAAMGSAQLRKIDKIIAEKRRVARSYSSRLKNVPGLRLPVELDGAFNVHWMYALVVEAGFPLTRDQLMERLKERGVDSRTFFCPMGQQPFLRSQKGFRETACPVADGLWRTGLYLPSSSNLTEETVAMICSVIAGASRS